MAAIAFATSGYATLYKSSSKPGAQTAPKGRKMGHAGAIVGSADDTAEAKMRIMGECGIHVVKSPADIGATVAQVMKG